MEPALGCPPIRSASANAPTSAARDDGARQRWLYFWLMNHGIVTRRGGNVSLPMTDCHVDRLLDESGNALRHMPN